ncbi:Holliday junction resolvase RuvX [Coprothermobacter platensis]|uniref:Holliday junction resolvase RuvX n=1 Tax=Coprothermobacter platensis TaxID=108819 RepID=UPI000378BA34|nr:Holliday junction resolvase RuvX [Coprothermobacter platensis]
MIVAIDYGTRRIGMAKSDPKEEWAFAHKTLSGVKLQEQLLAELNALKPNTVVIGLPKNMDGTESEMCAVVREIAKQIESNGYPVVFWDERLTSRIVGRQDPRSLKKAISDKGKVDLMSAVLILQEYISSRRKTDESQ